MDATQTIPDLDDEAAWAELARWIGDTPSVRLPHGLEIDTGEGRKTAHPGDLLFRDRDGQVAILFAGNLERTHAPPKEPETWDVKISIAHAHGDASDSIGVILGLADGRIDAKALAREIESFVGAATRPADITVTVEVRTRKPRGKPFMPSLEELKARAGETITGTF